MESIVDVVALVAISVLGAALARRLGFVAPLVLLVAGLALSYVPGMPAYHLDPELVLIGILPPLLYTAALQTSVPAFRRALRPILLLAVGLVLLTAFAVGIVMHVLLPQVPFADTASGGATIAPSATQAANGTCGSSTCTTMPTANAVSSTRPTASSRIGRSARRKAGTEVCSAAV